MRNNWCRHRPCREQFVSVSLGWLLVLFLYGIAITHLDVWEDRSFVAVVRMNQEGERIANETAHLKQLQQQRKEVKGMDRENYADDDEYNRHGKEQHHTMSLWKLVLIYMMVRLYAQQQRSEENLPQTQPHPPAVPLWGQQQQQEQPLYYSQSSTSSPTVLPPPAAAAAFRTRHFDESYADASEQERLRIYHDDDDVITDLHTGLSIEEIERLLPVQTFPAPATEESRMNSNHYPPALAQPSSYCSICLEPWEDIHDNDNDHHHLSPSQLRRILPLCGHAFHPHCIDPWLQRQSICPVCQQLVFLR
jgi:hypothetical protein